MNTSSTGDPPPVHGPPQGMPEVLFTHRYPDPEAEQAADRVVEQVRQQAAPGATKVPTRLVVRAADPASPQGLRLDPRPLRDVVLDVGLELLSGGPGTAFGVYLRQSVPDRYVLCVLTRERRFRMGLVDSRYQPVHDGNLADDIWLHTEGPNRITVVAFGPSLTFVVNGSIVTGALVDARYAEGVAGVWVQPGDDSGAELALDWSQARAVLAD